MKPMDANATHHKFDRVISADKPFTRNELRRMKYNDYVTAKFELVWPDGQIYALETMKERWDEALEEGHKEYRMFLNFDYYLTDLFPKKFDFGDGEVSSYDSKLGIVACTIKLVKSSYQKRKERLANSEKWVGDLQVVCVYDQGSWSVDYPFGGFSFPKRKDICTISNDGSPMLRFKVAKNKQDRPTFKLFQYRFRNSDPAKANKTDANGNKYSLYTSKCIHSFRRWVKSRGMTTNDVLSFEEIASYLKTTKKWGG